MTEKKLTAADVLEEWMNVIDEMAIECAGLDFDGVDLLTAKVFNLAGELRVHAFEIRYPHLKKKYEERIATRLDELPF